MPPVEVLKEGSASPLDAQAAPRFDTIDLLRGLSLLGVLLLHISLFLSFSGYEVGAHWPRGVHYVIFSEGGNGVSAFFAISGFLITYVSSRRFGSLARMSPWAFYRIRFARIMPMLLLLLAVLSLGHWLRWPAYRIEAGKGSLPGAVFAALTFHLNWYEVVHGWLPSPWTVLWSLSVEEMFYPLFPLLCLALYRPLRLRWTFFAVLLGLIAFGPFARQRWYSTSDIWLYQSYLGNVDNIAMGCLFALGTRSLEQRGKVFSTAWLRGMQVVGVGLALFIVVWDWPTTIFGWRVKRLLAHSALDVTVLGLGTCLCMMAGVLQARRGSRWTLPLRQLGRYSYEVYLSHDLVLMAVLSLFLTEHRGPVAVWVAGTVFLCFAVGALLSRWVSEPWNRRLRGSPVPAQLRAVTDVRAEVR